MTEQETAKAAYETFQTLGVTAQQRVDNLKCMGFGKSRYCASEWAGTKFLQLLGFDVVTFGFAACVFFHNATCHHPLKNGAVVSDEVIK